MDEIPMYYIARFFYHNTEFTIKPFFFLDVKKKYAFLSDY